MEAAKVATLKNLSRHLLGITRQKLEDTGWEASLDHYVVEQPTRVNSTGTGLPDDNVSCDEGSQDKVHGQGSKVERRDSIDEAIQRADFTPTVTDWSVEGSGKRIE